MSSITAAVQQTFLVAASAARSTERKFFTGLSITLLVVALIGFGPSYFLKTMSDRPALPAVLHVHGAVFTAWLVLLIVQSALIANGRRALHRTLGMAGAVLAVAMFVIGMWTAIARVRLGLEAGVQGPGGFPLLVFMAVPVLSIATFAGLIGAAVGLRHRTDTHKRLIMIATIDIVGAATARISGMLGTGVTGFPGGPILLLLVLAGYDYYSRGRIHPVTLWAGGFVAAMQPLRLAIGNTQAWQTFAGWLVG